MPKGLSEKVEDKYIVNPLNGCWEWIRVKDKDGYGRYGIRIGNRIKQHRAHRYIYEKALGKIPKDKVLDHLCKNVCCVNPLHMEIVSVAENTRRGKSAKLNREKVDEIRRLYKLGNETLISLATKFDVTWGLIWQIVRKKIWIK